MQGFEVDKYQGRWYENAFHDWTQFTEVECAPPESAPS
jgi:lipocalin